MTQFSLKVTGIFTLLIASLLSTTNAWSAEQQIRLAPGSSITLDPGTTTTVSCGSTSASEVLYYCRCERIQQERSRMSTDFYLRYYRVSVLTGVTNHLRDLEFYEPRVEVDHRTSVGAGGFIRASTKESCERGLLENILCKR